MKRFISALTLCVSLLLLLSVFLFPPVGASENPLLTLLNLPAPPPPNPLVTSIAKTRDPKFYNKSDPPMDNASIEDLLDYWGNQNDSYTELGYNPRPSDRTAERIYAAIEKTPKILGQYLNILPEGKRSAEFVKELYDREGANGVYTREERSSIKRWLTYHSPFFSSDLAQVATRAGEADDYVTNQEELLALTSVDFDRAKPIIDRLYANSSQKASQVLARWSLYKHALEIGSTSDIETYRDELKAVVEDKTATPGMRDLALDALAKEKEWPGRDDWYYTLLADETLADLRVQGRTFTGLTTMLMVSPDEKYIGKMLELVKSDNPHVRAAAVRNLVLKLGTNNPEIAKALIPWLEDPKWALDSNDARGTLIRQLGEYEIPESVPGLIKVLDEKQRHTIYPNANATNMAANSVYYSSNANAAVSAAANAANRMANAAGQSADHYPNRFSAVTALAKQKDARAVPALRRILPDGESYERGNTVRAILVCNGFTIAEQLDALEMAAKGVRAEMDAEDAPPAGNFPVANGASANFDAYRQKRPLTAVELRSLLGDQLSQSTEISDELARAIVDRIESIEAKDPRIAAAYRKMILKWQNAAINLLLLRDVKRGIAGSDTMLRLLGQRKSLREQHSSDVFDLRNGKGAAIGIAASLAEDIDDYTPILEGVDIDAKIALLACARLIRAPLLIPKVAENLKSTNELLKIAAERYLESEDSPEARSIVLSRYPNEIKILGARAAFVVDGFEETASEYLWLVYKSLGDDSLYNGWYGSGNDGEIIADEKRLRAEIKKDETLVGVYAYDRHYVRIYKDRVMFSWDEDDSRYRERSMNKDEFDELKAYFTASRVDELPPFLSCGGDYCTAKELVMLGRDGGRRVYVNGGFEQFSAGRGYDFFNGLEKYFAGLKQSPATLRYKLSREIPGLEIIMASDELHADTVWKDGSDLRIAGSATAVRKKINADIENVDEQGIGSVDYDEREVKKAELREKRRFEGFAWYKVVNGGFEPGAAQPPQVEFITIRDGHAVQPSDEQWKARAGDFEIRTSESGLFKLVRGKLTKLHSGKYDNAVVTADGRWAIVQKTDDKSGSHIVRVDLSTNKEYAVVIEGYGERYPSAIVPSLNRVLIVPDNGYGYESEYESAEDDVVPIDPDPESMFLVDISTGAVQPLPGEFRPLDHQTFRPLQKSTKPNELWAAMPDAEKNETQVGLYDSRTFTFRPVLRIPKIKFNSMSMWVDEAGGKIYFVYRGHVLALPLAK